MHALYYAPGACSLSPHIVLREAGLEFTLVKVSTKTKEMEGGGDFRTINPLGYVPALKLPDGTVMTEGPLFNPNLGDEAKAIFRTKIQDRFKWVDEQLANQDWLLGKQFSAADAYLFTISNWAKPMGVDLGPLSNLLAFRKRMAERPSVQAAMAAEGLNK